MTNSEKEELESLDHLMRELTGYFNSLEEGHSEMGQAACHQTLERLYDAVVKEKMKSTD
jgi:hypothetical protein